MDNYRVNEAGIFVPLQPVEHRDDDYDPAGFDLLRRMQDRHFWYRGRHRFLLAATRRALNRYGAQVGNGLRAVDLGGGCGGWIHYLQCHAPQLFSELALADSSLEALGMAAEVTGPGVSRYQVDLLRLGWKDRWDVAFLLDVLEHIPDDVAVLTQIRESLRPGGLLLVTTPALNFFWSYNDEAAHHVRRYARGDFRRLAAKSGFESGSTHYFMFLLSPMLFLSRLSLHRGKTPNSESHRRRVERAHRVPAWPVNELLALTFALETPAGLWCPFPWGTSVLAVFQKNTD